MSTPIADPPSSAPTTAPFEVTEQQRRFFQTFGFVRFDGLFADDIADITSAFDDVVTASESAAADSQSVMHESDIDQYNTAFEELERVETHDHVHFGKRRIIVPFVLEKHERLAAIPQDDRFVTAARALIGPEYEVVGSDGNVFHCDTSWHYDFLHAPLDQLFVKFFLYLDPVDGDTGSLRVIPGSNHWDTPFAAGLRGSLADWRSIDDALGVPGDQIPHWPIDSRPGDMIAAYYRTLHATYGGVSGRRLIAMNLHGPGSG